MTHVTSSSRRARSGLAVLIALMVIFSAAPARSASEEEVEAARRAAEEAAAARAAALTDLNEATAAYEAINAEYQDLIFRIGQMRSRIDAYQAEVRDMRAEIRERAVAAYMMGPTQGTASGLFVSDRAQQALVAQQVLAAAVAEQSASLDTMEAITAEMTRLEDQLEADTGRSSELRIEAEAVAARLYELLDEKEAALAGANQELAEQEAALAEQQRQEELERQRRLSLEYRQEVIRQALLDPAGGAADEVTPGFVCPVGGATAYADSWGAPRSDGHHHQGVDMMGPKNTPLVAAADGVILQRTSVLGGIVVVLQADYGAGFLYAHLNSYAAGQSTGSWVAAGTVIGYMGDTGNAAPGGYHLHFEIRPLGADGVAVNPYQTLVRHGC
jgi:peptidoglycan LD-endopeptidase LytH